MDQNDSPTCGNWRRKVSTLSVKWQRNSLTRSCCTPLVKTPASCCIWRVRRFIRVRCRSRYCTLIPVGNSVRCTPFAIVPPTHMAASCWYIKNPEGVAMGINPFVHGSAKHTDIMKTEGLKQALNKYGFDAAFGGARRDEENPARKNVFTPFVTVSIAGTRKSAARVVA